MTTLRLMLGLLWLASTIWILLLPCLKLWYLNSKARGVPSFNEQYASWNAGPAVLPVCYGIAIGLGCFWWEYMWLCCCTAIGIHALMILSSEIGGTGRHEKGRFR